VRLPLVEQQDGGGDAGAEEQVGGQTNDAIKQVFLNDLAADGSLPSTAEQDTVRNHDGDATGTGLGGLDHVEDEGVVGLGLGRNATLEATKAVVGSLFRAPLVEGKRRIGDNDVELTEGVVCEEFRVVEGVAPFDLGTIDAVEEHVHPAKSVGRAVHLLAEEGEVVGG